MPDIALVLGPVSFLDFEIPARINFGGKQILAVHQMTDGRRVVDTIGPSETEIEFSGAFSGSTASARARQLDSLRSGGVALSLAWDVFCYTVILSRFDAHYQNPVWIPYRIVCTVLRDEATPDISPAVSLASSLLDDLNTAANQCTGSNIDFSDAVATLTCPGATTLGTSEHLTAQSMVGNVQSTMTAGIMSAQAALQVPTLPTSSSPASAIADFIALSAAAQQLAVLTTANGYVGRAARNLTNVST